MSTNMPWFSGNCPRHGHSTCQSRSLQEGKKAPQHARGQGDTGGAIRFGKTGEKLAEPLTLISLKVLSFSLNYTFCRAIVGLSAT